MGKENFLEWIDRGRVFLIMEMDGGKGGMGKRESGKGGKRWYRNG